MSEQWHLGWHGASVIACPDPVKIVNATHCVKKGLRLRTVVYKCLPGFYDITGNKMRTCLPNGTWTGADIECKVSAVDFYKIFVPEDEPPSTYAEKVMASIGYLNADQRPAAVATGSVMILCLTAVIPLLIMMDLPVLKLHFTLLMLRNLRRHP
ncbi:hypothetical protein LSAT2_010702 [Lamellibrachia satsuma]|nr:hypothetical protein LSAT2_010702 [Lamellibrachia satsuma]